MKNLGYYGRRNICGERVRMARLAKRISQETLAAKMQTLGVNIAQDAISNIEAGRRLRTPGYGLRTSRLRDRPSSPH